MKLRMKFTDQIVGMFILLAVVALIAGFVFIGINNRLFQKNWKFTSKFISASGLSVGMPVKLKGIEIGKLIKANLDTKTMFIQVEFSIYDEYYRDVALPHSVIELVSVLGFNNDLIFHPGKSGDPPPSPLDDGAYIPSNQTEEGQELEREQLVEFSAGEDSLGSLIAKVNPILSQLQPILLSVRRISVMVEDALRGRRTNELGKFMTTLNESLRGNESTPVGSILVNVKGISEKLDTELVTLGRIMTDIEKITANPKGLVADLIDPDGSLYKNINAMLDSTREILDDLETFTHFVSGTTPQLAGIIEESKKAIDDGQDVLEALKNNPFLKGGVPLKKEQPSTFQGYRDEEF